MEKLLGCMRVRNYNIKAHTYVCCLAGSLRGARLQEVTMSNTCEASRILGGLFCSSFESRWMDVEFTRSMNFIRSCRQV